MGKKDKILDVIVPVSIIALTTSSLIMAFKKCKNKDSNIKEIIARTQLLSVDYSNDNIEEYIEFIQNKPLGNKEMSCIIEAYHLLNSYDVERKYINDIRLILEMNGYVNPFKIYTEKEE